MPAFIYSLGDLSATLSANHRLARFVHTFVGCNQGTQVMPRLPGCRACWLPLHCLAALYSSSAFVCFHILRVLLFLRFFPFAFSFFYHLFLLSFPFTVCIPSFFYACVCLWGRLMNYFSYALCLPDTFVSVLHTLPYSLRTGPLRPGYNLLLFYVSSHLPPTK